MSISPWGGGLLIAALATAAPLAGHGAPAAIYVSAVGDDAASGLAAGHPVRSLDHARDLARRLPAPRVVHLLGHFRSTAPLALGAADSGTSWIGDGMAEIDGGGTLAVAITGGGLSDARFSGFAVANTTAHGIYLTNPARIRIDHLRLHGIRSQHWAEAAIYLIGNTDSVVVASNRITDSGYVAISAFVDGPRTIHDLMISGNTILHSCSAVADCGAIYVNGRGATRAITIAGNVVIDFGPRGAQTKAIYLDDWASGATVTGNCIVGPGDYAFQIHGGANNRLADNRIDAAAIGAVLLNQPVAGAVQRSMAGNRLVGNRIYHGAGVRLVHDAGAGQLPDVAGNSTPPGGLRCPAR